MKPWPNEYKRPYRTLLVVALLVGVVAAVICALALPADPAAFYRAYLIGFLFWFSFSLGSLAIAMLHELTGGAWGMPIRRNLEAAAATMPLIALLFVPLALNMPLLWVWADESVMATDTLVQAKQPYLNVPFFLIRAVVYFVIWILMAWLFNAWSLAADRAGMGHSRRHLRLLAAPGLLLFGLTITFASVDWGMSLEPHWFSAMYGILFVGAHGVAGMALAVLMAVAFSRTAPIAAVITPQRLNDLGNFLLAFVMFWSYVSTMQYLIIWSANLPEETPWYLNRKAGGWEYVAMALILFHFAVPMLLLLSRNVKRKGAYLAMVVSMLLVMRWVDNVWLVAPAFSPARLSIHWLYVMLPVAMGGFWLAIWAWRMSVRAQWPVFDLHTQEAGHDPAGHTAHSVG